MYFYRVLSVNLTVSGNTNGFLTSTFPSEKKSWGSIIGVIKLWAMLCEGVWVFAPDGSLGVASLGCVQ